ncbi:hypothetical protein RHMOL_Rhmol04G0324700 [Rhododendron molle]|uniref:Uncharacterized protein n=1 Tax=Rhododendron molle TaxID=49168 RepID=A0ACC0P6F6_RHOML|nr:hypothetical protein RHMOL_Rhmol04G0324700 [Rhododendron molle]
MALHAFITNAMGMFRLYLFIMSTSRRPEPRPELFPNPNFYQTHVNNINRLVRGNDTDCHEQLRVNRHTFLRLCFLVRGVRLGDSRNVCLEERVAIFLWVLGHHTMQRRTKYDFWRSIETNCLGALDGTYVPVNPPAVDRPRYRSRKGEIATNVLGVCSRDQKFVYVLSGWEGSATDSRILQNAIEIPDGLIVPHGHYYLVDAGYTNGNGFLAPYHGQRYHINIWRQGHMPVSKEEYFNMKHSAARNVIERTFGVLKKRFAILRLASYYPIRTQTRIVTAYSSNEWTVGRDALAAAMYNHWSYFYIRIFNLNNAFAAMDNEVEEVEPPTKGKRRNWSSKEENALIKCVVNELVGEKWRAENGFRGGFFNHVEKELEKFLPGTTLKANPHIDSKVKYWKVTWAKIVDIIALSGFGWDDVNKRIVVEKDVWENYEKDRATGAGVETPATMGRATNANQSLPTFNDCYIPQFGEDYGAFQNDSPMSPATPTTPIPPTFTPHSSLPTSTPQTSVPHPNAGGTKRKRTRMGDEELSMFASMKNWMTSSDGHMEKMVNCFGYDKELSARRTQVPDELSKLDITLTEKFKLGAVICQEEQRVDNFYGIKPEERQAYVEAILSGVVYGHAIFEQIVGCFQQILGCFQFCSAENCMANSEIVEIFLLQKVTWLRVVLLSGCGLWDLLSIGVAVSKLCPVSYLCPNMCAAIDVLTRQSVRAADFWASCSYN